jgi:hypothetical protein
VGGRYFSSTFLWISPPIVENTANSQNERFLQRNPAGRKGTQRGPPGAKSPFAVLEEFYLAEALFRFRFRFVRAAQVLSLFGEHFVAAFHFCDHRPPPGIFLRQDDKGQDKKQCRTSHVG